VGTAINVEHLRATAIGAAIKAEAVLEATDGKYYVLRVTADDGKQEIGRGTVTRAFVNLERFLAKTK
jgi:predicted thioesterase